MPQQLIYTSAPRGIVAGRSGYCTVARSAGMREALMLQLEKFSYYQHLSLTGGQNRPIFACRLVDIRGTRFHVLSRLQDAGLDFTGRTNFIAHHLVFTPEEIRKFPSPPVILGRWPGWRSSWTGEPQSLENEDWSALAALNAEPPVPARTWEKITGAAANGYGLLETRAGATFRVEDQGDEIVLAMFAESLALLEIRDPRGDRFAAWNHTFTTSMQEQDNPADFRWRCLHSDNPAASRFATPDCRRLTDVRAVKCTAEEVVFAQKGPHAPTAAVLAADKREIEEGTAVRLEVQTDGVPTPTIRWFEIELDKPKELAGVNGVVQSFLPEGRAKRYQVQAYNRSGRADSNVVEISIRSVPKLGKPYGRGGGGGIESNRGDRVTPASKGFEIHHTEPDKDLSPWWFIAVLLVAGGLVAGGWWFKRQGAPKPKPNPSGVVDQGAAPIPTNNGSTNNVPTSAPPPAPEPAAVVPTPSETSPPTPPPTHILFDGNPNPWPVSWKKSAIGDATDDFAANFDAGTFVIKNYCRQFPGNADHFFYVYQSLPKVAGKVVFVARLASFTNTANSVCGIMIRASIATNAPFAFIGIYQTNSLYHNYRTSSGPPNPLYRNDVHPPVLLRIARTANVFTMSYSNESTGATWPDLGTEEITMPGTNYLAGFAVLSETNPLAEAKFEFVTNRVASP